ncbi:hypothetical protein diail_2727 [Diaporthe ilicicola]|nr:hypothetical protein diail_2727 [Diaporthe ilicicola]
MASSDELRALAWSGMPRRLVNILALLLLVRFGLFLYNGWCIRMRFRKLQAEGIAIPCDHSLAFGHLLLLKRVRALLPKDSTSTYAIRHITMNWREYFPESTTYPSVVYLDFWPFSEPVALINDPALCQIVTADRFPIRDEQGKYLARLMAGPRNTFAFDGDEHKRWRTRLNPGFSARNLQSHISGGKIVDEVLIFAERLKKGIGEDGQLGGVFQLFPMAVDLTFDIICRIVLDFSPGEQLHGPTEMQAAFRVISQHLVWKSWASLHKRLNPFWQLEMWSCHRTLRRVMLPHIKKHLGEHSMVVKNNSSTQNTVLDLTLKEIEMESPGIEPSNQFIEVVVGLTKQFIFAGHDTTAINMAFMYHFLNKSPDALNRLRAEHNRIFGPDPSKAPEVLRQSPHLLNSLPFTTAVVKETLRLAPVASSIRKGHPGYSVRGSDGIEYPMGGFIVNTGVSCLQFSPEMFARPTEFHPERWDAPAGHPLHIQDEAKYAWRPFEWGPMSCIGQELAWVELKMALLFTVREVEVVTALEDWDRLQGRDPEKRPSLFGDKIFQRAVGLGPPTESLPVRVRAVR